MRRLAEAALARSAQQLRLALEGAELGAWEYRSETGELFFDERCRALWGMAGDARIDYAAALAGIHLEDQPAIDQAVKGALAGAEGVACRREFRVVWPDGSEHWIAAHGRVHFDAGPREPRRFRFVGVCRDITPEKLAEQALRASEQRYRAMVETALEGIWVLDADACTSYVNPRMAVMLGYSTDQILGRRLFDFMDFDARAEAEGKLDRRRSGGEPQDLRFRRQDGSLLWAQVSTAPLRGPDGTYQGALAMLVDITERKRMEGALRERERLYRAIGESIDYGVWVCDAEGRNIYASESFLKMVGLTLEQCANFGWRVALHPDDLQPTIEGWQRCVRTEGTWDIEQRFRGVDGEWHPILARGVPVSNEEGEVIYWAGINLDISRLARTEAALREGQAALREADRRKNEFLAVLSHELRNPLAPIRNSLSILDQAPADSEQARRAKTIIGRQVGQLTRMVDDLLDVTRITQGKIQVQRRRCELTELVRCVAEDHEAQFAAAGLRFEVAISRRQLWVQGDAARLAQAIGNLLQNAVKFGGKGGTVRLSVEEETGAGSAVVQVRDSGLGLSAEVLERLFRPFTQADHSLDRSQGGLGLGLALVKALADLHGGSIEAASDGPGTGAEFTLRLPLLPPPPLLRTPLAPPAARVVPRRVLIIEDNVDAAETLREALTFKKHQVEVAHSGPEGISKARSFEPDLVFCDIGLPGMDGYQVATAIRADPELRGLHLVALTGYALPDDIRKAIEAGFDQHLAKPAGLEQLEAALLVVSGSGLRPAGPSQS